MMLFDANDRGGRDAIQIASAAPLQELPETFGAGFDAGWDTALTEDQSVSRARVETIAWQQILDDAQKKTGQRLGNPGHIIRGSNPVDMLGDAISETLFDRPWNFSAKGNYQSAKADTLTRLRELRDAGHDIQVPTDQDLMDRMQAIADERHRRNEAAMTGGGAGAWGSLAGQMTGVMADPANVISLAFGAPVGAGFWRTVGTEASVNMVTEAANQIEVTDWKQDLGRDYGISEAALNVGMAGTGAAALTSLGYGLSSAVRALRGGKIQTPDTPEARAAAAALDREAIAQETNPYMPTVRGENDHADRLNAAEAMLNGDRAAADHLRKSLDDVVLPTPPEGVRFDLDNVKPGDILTPDQLPAYVHGILKPRNFFIPANEGQRFLFDLAKVPKRLTKAAAKHNPKFANATGKPLRVSNEVITKLYRNLHNDIPTAHRMVAELPDLIFGFKDVGKAKKGRVVSELELLNGGYQQKRRAVFELRTDGDSVEIVSIHLGQIKAGGRKNAPPASGGGLPNLHTAGASKNTPAAADFPTVPVRESMTPNGGNVNRTPDFRPLPDALRAPNGNRRPVSLLGFLRSKGGLKDEAGELAAMDLNKARPGTVSGKGIDFDMAREAAAEAGYLPKDATIRDFLDAVREEAGGHMIYRAEDADQVQAWDAYQTATAEAADLLGGVDAARGMDNLAYADAIDAARVQKVWAKATDGQMPISDAEALDLSRAAMGSGRDIDDVVDDVAEARAMMIEVTRRDLEQSFIPFDTDGLTTRAQGYTNDSPDRLQQAQDILQESPDMEMPWPWIDEVAEGDAARYRAEDLFALTDEMETDAAEIFACVTGAAQ